MGNSLSSSRFATEINEHPDPPSSNPNSKMLGIESDVQIPFANHATTTTTPSSTCYFSTRPLNVELELMMEVNESHTLSQSGPGPEVLPSGSTSVAHALPQFTPEAIDPSFRVPVATDQKPVLQPQEASDLRSPSADGQRPPRKISKKGAQGPRLRKACDSCSKRKVKVCYQTSCSG